MEREYLHQVLPFLKDLNRERREQFEHYFATAPKWLLDSFQIEEMEKGVLFVRENMPIDTIFFLAKGSIKGTDYRVNGISYDFIRFDHITAFGGMEVLLDEKYYKATLETVTQCTMIKIPVGVFKRWMESDILALKKEAKRTVEYMLEESRMNRVYLFSQGAERLIMHFARRYEVNSVNGQLVVRNTREELADATGLSVKTINRAIKQLEESGMLKREGHTIRILEENYQRLKAATEDKVSLD